MLVQMRRLAVRPLRCKLALPMKTPSCFLLVLLAALSCSAATSQRPNILLIVPDGSLRTPRSGCEKPEEVKTLSAEWKAWAAHPDVLPLGGWRGNPAEKKGE